MSAVAPPVGEGVTERLAAVRQAIRDACERCDRDPADVTLVGVSKRQPLERIRAAVDAGLRVFGETRVQEAVTKSAELVPNLDWHLIGPLQSNKTKPAVRLFGTVHSVDRPKIARLLDKEAGRQGRRIHGFLEVNLGDEPTKHGFVAQGLAEAVRPFADFEHLRIVGLMAIPPYEKNLDRARRWFRLLRDRRDEICELSEWNRSAEGPPALLSMGMSHDFEVAIEEEATHVRIGTSIFGVRPE